MSDGNQMRYTQDLFTLTRRNLKTQISVACTLIRHENGAFRKRSSNWRNLETPADFENEDFWKQWGHDNHDISLPEFSSNTNQEWSVIVAFRISP